MTISLPPKMAEAVEKVRRAEQRTRSELIREALRTYFASRRFSEVTPTPAELRAIRRGHAAYERGDYVTLNELRHEMGTSHRRTRKKIA